MFIDIKKAHLNGVLGPGEVAYVSLPDGCCQPGTCGRLNRWLYGMRPAANAWERDFTEKLGKLGFMKGESATTSFYNPVTQARCVVHGDDFTFLGWESDLKNVAEKLKEDYELKVRGMLGGEWSDQKEIVILNRRLTWANDEMTYEADLVHARKILEMMNLN